MADVIGRHRNLPTAAVLPEKASQHFGWLTMVTTTDQLTSSALTRELVDWRPTQPGLIGDLDEGHYFHAPTAPAHAQAPLLRNHESVMRLRRPPA